MVVPISLHLSNILVSLVFCLDAPKHNSKTSNFISMGGGNVLKKKKTKKIYIFYVKQDFLTSVFV